MKKILVPAFGFFPAQNYGGPPVSLLNICNLINDNFEFFIVTSNHDLKDDKNSQGLRKVGIKGITPIFYIFPIKK